jgi:tRNA(Met) C34 N-acetyltransferase TmcA
LVEHVHRSEPADLWGTLFGATAGLVAFRRRVGYDVAGLSASRGIRTGEPSVLMLRPTTDAAQRLLAELRLELARELPLRLQLLADDGGIDIDPTLVAALQQGLPETTPYSAAEAESLACAYADGPRTFESVASAIRTFVETRDLGELPDDERDVVERRVLRASSWEETTRGAGLANPRIAMRSLRRAIRRLARSPR